MTSFEITSVDPASGAYGVLVRYASGVTWNMVIPPEVLAQIMKNL